jgi:hypothetical protein
MHRFLLIVVLAAMCWPLWSAVSEANEHIGPHNSSTLELALIGFGTLAIFWLTKQARLPRAVRLPDERLPDESSASVPVRYAEAKAEAEREGEAAEHAA